MKVFISWSGELSQRLAAALREWLPGVIQAVEPYFTPADIDKGARWNKEIAQELENSQFGIIVLTRENLERPWIMFESGALSKQLNSSRVCPILFGVEKTDLQGPLVQFQAAQFNKSDIKKLIQTMNELWGEHRLKDSVLNSAFDMWWPKLECDVNDILEEYAHQANSTILRSDRELIDEVLELSRTIVKKSNGVEGPIKAGAIVHLVEHFLAAHDALRHGKNEDVVMQEIALMSKALGHLVHRGIDDLPTKNRLRSSLENLSFERRRESS